MAKNSLASIIDQSSYGLLIFGPDFRASLINRVATDLLGISNEEEITDLESFLRFSKSIPDLHHRLSAKSKNKESFELFNVLHLNRYLIIKYQKLPEGTIVTIIDNTSVKDAEIKSLRSLIKVLEREKKRLAAEIHDGIGPTLSAIKLNLQLVQSELETVHSGTIKRLNSTYKLIDDLANDMRSISHALLPKVLLDFGLIAALENLCEKVEEVSDIKVEFQKPLNSYKMDLTTELNIYRIVQELFNNTLKYAHAGRIILRLIFINSYLRLFYSDDGRGFDLNEPSPGIGLLNIRTRTRAMKGKFTIQSRPGKGVESEIEVPLKKK